MENDEFTVPPPDFSEEQYGHLLPPNPEAAWIMQLIQVRLEDTKLPEGLKKRIISDMEILINTIGMTNLVQGQVNEFRYGFLKIWRLIKVLYFRRKYKTDFNYLEAIFEELFTAKANGSIFGWQGNNIFQKTSTMSYEMKNKGQEEKKGFLGRRRGGTE